MTTNPVTPSASSLTQPQNIDIAKTSDNPLLTKAMEHYLADLEAGTAVGRDEFAERYPDIADELKACLDGLEFLHVVAPQLNESARDGRAPHTIKPLATLGDFRIVREIGRGGMGVVYEAEQLSLGRNVAIKVLPFAAILDQRQLERFRNEVRAAAMLKHPHIVSVYQIGNERGVHFYAMELIEGQSLDQMIERLRPDAADQPFTDNGIQSGSSALSKTDVAETQAIADLSTQRIRDRHEYYRSVARLGIEAAEALQYAHHEGVVHRDIKPSNLLIDHDGKLWITDFGLARIQNSDDQLTMSGDVVGTLRYMSPEQAAGRQGVADHRTDVYSLGVSLYELLTGKPALPGENRQDLFKQLEDLQPILPRRHDPAVPQDLETIVMTAMARELADRYSTAGEMGDDLRRFLEFKPIRASRPSRLHRASRWIRRNPVLATLLAMVALLLLAVTLGSTSVAIQSIQEAKQQELDLYARDMQLAQQAVEGGSFLGAERILLNWVPNQQNGFSDHRGPEWTYLWNRSHDSALEQTIQYRLPARNVMFLNEGNRLLIARWSKRIDIWNLKVARLTEPDEQLIVNTSGVNCPQKLNHSNVLVAGDDGGEITHWDLSNYEQIETYKVDCSPTHYLTTSIAVTEDDRLLAVGLAPGTIQIRNRARKSQIRTIEGLAGAPRIAFGKKGELFVACEMGCRLSVYTINPQVDEEGSLADEESHSPTEPPFEYDLDADGAGSLAISSDGQTLVLGTYRQSGDVLSGHIDVWDTENLRPIRRILLGNAKIHSVRFSSDESLLAVGDDNGDLFLIDTQSWQVRTARRVHAGTVADVAFSADGSRLATVGGDCRVHIGRNRSPAKQPMPNSLVQLVRNRGRAV